MKNQKEARIFGAYFFIGLLIEWFLFWLFPNTGMGGMICWPIAIILSTLIGFVLYKLVMIPLSLWMVIPIAVVLLVFQTKVQLGLMPQDFGGKPSQQISEAKAAYCNYDKIHVAQSQFSSSYEVIVFKYKFQYVEKSRKKNIKLNTGIERVLYYLLESNKLPVDSTATSLNR